MLLENLKQELDRTINFFGSELSSIHTGRASSSLVDGVMVEVYGSKVPLRQVANITVSDTKTISIQPWDRGNLQPIEKAVRESDLGLSPVNDGNVVRINIPELTEVRRKEYVKVAKDKAEEARISVRNQRREAMEFYKKQKNDNIISENEMFAKEKDIQKIVDEYNKKVDESLIKKEKELLEV